MKTIVIGAGIAGIASSIRLAAKGYDVTVFESNSYPGGKLTEIKCGEYRFDAGPSLFTLPHLVKELYDIAGKNFEQHFPYKKKEVTCNYFWEDGTSLIAYADREKLVAEFQEKLHVSPEKLNAYLDKAAKKYEAVGELFLEKPLHHSSTWLSKEVVKALPKLGGFGLMSTMNEVNEKQFSNEKAIQLFNRYATYNGSNPYTAPGLLTMIPHLEFNIGTYFPKNGMHQITQSLYEMAKEIGVEFKFNSIVEEILFQNKKVTGVKSDGKEHVADIVVSNMDVYPTYKKLLTKIDPPSKTIEQERSSSAIIFYWGIKKQFEQLELHNIFFSDDYRQEFEVMFNQKNVFDDPTVYVNITSKNKPSDAPHGCENWFILVNAPTKENQNWEEIVARTRTNVIAKLSRMLGENIEALIEEEDTLTPALIEQRTSSYGGSLYGTSSNNKYAAFLRHKNESSQLDGLYFCGGSVHPGGGIPLCLNSAKIATNLITKKYRAKV